jgi:MFS transporter, FHS family, glucose/mannose:H+ symporter
MLSESRTRLMASAVAGQWVFGIILALFGQLFGIPVATAHAGLDLDAQARLLLTLFTGQLLFTAITGRAVDRLGSTRVLGAGSLVMGAAVFLLASAAGFRQAMIAALLMSLGGAAVNAAANTLVSTLYGARRGPMLNVLGVFGAAGAVSVPLVFSGVITYAQVRTRLLLLGGACALAGVLHLLQSRPAAAGMTAAPKGTTRAALKDPWVLALAVVLIIDFGNEAVMAGWIAPYTLAAVPPASPTAMVGLYWGALVAGRVMTPFVLARISKLVLLGLASFAAAAGFAAISTARTPVTLALAVLLTGLAIAPMAPTTLSVAGDRYQKNTGAVFGLLLSLGQLGGMILPWSVARVAVMAGFRAGILVSCGSGVLMTLLLWSLVVRTRRAAASAGGPP